MALVAVVLHKPETIVIKLVVGSEGGEGAGADAVSKEDLSGGVDPRGAILHVAPVDLEERVEKRMQLASSSVCLHAPSRSIVALWTRNSYVQAQNGTMIEDDQSNKLFCSMVFESTSFLK